MKRRHEFDELDLAVVLAVVYGALLITLAVFAS